jgi:chemotaxis protein methyltransferase CheR
VTGPERIAQASMTDAEFRMFANLVREHCGIHFGPDLRYLLEKRVTRRVERIGLSSFGAYHYHLRHEPDGDQELACLVDDVTTNETYFMRELNQLRALIHEILPELLGRQRSGRPINIWSAGCSSGEEPYSIVMLGLEAGLEPGRDLRVYASDIDRTMLEKARAGVYRPSSFREMESPLREKYFSRKDEIYRISDSVKRHVCFAHTNLLDPARTALLGSFDVVLCRNVIIYFDSETKRRVITGFSDRIRPGGYLLLGHSESLINLSNEFQLRHLRHDMVYRKPGIEDPPDTWDALAEAALQSTDRARGDR